MTPPTSSSYVKITGLEPFVVATFHNNARRHWLLFKLLTNQPGLFGLGITPDEKVARTHPLTEPRPWSPRPI